MRPPIEWKVPSHGMPSTAWPSIWPRRSFISRAALLVKVTERISPGRARPWLRMWAIRRGQHAGLAGAGAGQHQHRAVQRFDRLALLGIEPVEIVRARRRARTRGNAASRGLVVGDAVMGQFARLGHVESSSPTMAPRGGEGEPS